MKKQVYIFAVAALFLGGTTLFTGCSGGSDAPAEETEETEEAPAEEKTPAEDESAMEDVGDAEATTAAYVCPMGCSSSDKPGQCSVCKMDLVKADSDEAEGDEDGDSDAGHEHDHDGDGVPDHS